jgi:hypothetical protein
MSKCIVSIGLHAFNNGLHCYDCDQSNKSNSSPSYAAPSMDRRLMLQNELDYYSSQKTIRSKLYCDGKIKNSR